MDMLQTLVACYIKTYSSVGPIPNLWIASDADLCHRYSNQRRNVHTYISPAHRLWVKMIHRPRNACLHSAYGGRKAHLWLSFLFRLYKLYQTQT